MKPNPDFFGQGAEFWAYVRAISQIAKYSDRGTGTVKAPTHDEINAATKKLGLSEAYLISKSGSEQLLHKVHSYLVHRAAVLNSYVEPRLLRVDQARDIFNAYAAKGIDCPIPNNKQKGAMSGPAYFTGIINMVITENALGRPVDFDPRNLTIFTQDKQLVGALSRHVDGCFPSRINPIAVWEIKEYYYTTTFGSRIADAVYETLLDGFELNEIETATRTPVDHLLMVDAYQTWWTQGRSYLCRMVDLLHMGFVDHVLFGREVVEELPSIVQSWVGLYDSKSQK